MAFYLTLRGDLRWLRGSCGIRLCQRRHHGFDFGMLVGRPFGQQTVQILVPRRYHMIVLAAAMRCWMKNVFVIARGEFFTNQAIGEGTYISVLQLEILCQYFAGHRDFDP